jgi:FMN phosphatase YigB (HAD superfamily)
MQTFKNLIFDLGEVIIDIDYRQTIAAFQKLAVVDFSEVVSYAAQSHIFDLYEKGKVSTADFRNELRKFLKPGTTDKEIEDAWNAIFFDFPQHKIDMLKQLKSRYKTFALSNINEIHVTTINEVAKEKFGEADFGSFFNGAYYSNEVGYRKPEKEIYELILNKENLVADETFFVDDKHENVEAARAFGIHAYQLKDRNKLNELLAELKII